MGKENRFLIWNSLFGLLCFLTDYFSTLSLHYHVFFASYLTSIFGYINRELVFVNRIRSLAIPSVCNPVSILESRDTLPCWEWSITNTRSGSVVKICSNSASDQPAWKVKSGECLMPQHQVAKKLTPRNYFILDSSDAPQVTWNSSTLLSQTGDPSCHVWIRKWQLPPVSFSMDI